MAHFKRHQVVEMDESNVQRCVLCGEVITDASNGIFPAGQKPAGFPPGEVFVTGGNPVHIHTQIKSSDTSEDCI